MESLLYGFLGILEFSFVFSSMIPCTEYVAGAVSEVIRDMGNVFLAVFVRTAMQHVLRLV